MLRVIAMFLVSFSNLYNTCFQFWVMDIVIFYTLLGEDWRASMEYILDIM